MYTNTTSSIDDVDNCKKGIISGMDTYLKIKSSDEKFKKDLLRYFYSIRCKDFDYNQIVTIDGMSPKRLSQAFGIKY